MMAERLRAAAAGLECFKMHEEGCAADYYQLIMEAIKTKRVSVYDTEGEAAAKLHP